MDLMQHLRVCLAKLPGQDFGDYRIENCDDFSYTDPVDNSVSEQQGIRLLFSNGSRIVYRLSGTGTEGATLRVYLERFEADPTQLQLEPQQALSDLMGIAEQIADINRHTGRTEPSVVT